MDLKSKSSFVLRAKWSKRECLSVLLCARNLIGLAQALTDRRGG